MDLKKTVAYSLIAAGVAGVLAFSSTKEVHASSGTVYIQEGNKMTGMWVHVEGGRSGWAYWRHKFGNQYEWRYDTQGKKMESRCRCKWHASIMGYKCPRFQLDISARRQYTNLGKSGRSLRLENGSSSLLTK